ncbi:MAG: sigma-70 family RNA polymerase sigma factor [Dyadobacter sp.]|uniref:RNA polymerase sigma factor n=1 Tax=Dyadobacter sp. TaxID=1914288 RepID=UPI003263F9DA
MQHFEIKFSYYQIIYDSADVMNKYRDDHDLWALVIEGDQSAYEELYRRYFQVLFSYGKQFVRDEDLISDAIQDLFVDIWRTRFSLSQAQSVKFYLFRSIRRKIHRLTKRKLSGNEDLEDLGETFLPIERSPEELLISVQDVSDQSKKLHHLLAKLPTRQSEAIILRYYHELEYSEIAQLLEIKEQSVRNLVQKALQMLRRALISFFLAALIIF